VTLFLQDGGKE
jgi:hypothetical protein